MQILSIRAASPPLSHFIAHNIGGVGYFADHIAVMNRGRIEESGPATTVLHSPQADYTRLLLAAVPRIEAAAALGRAE